MSVKITKSVEEYTKEIEELNKQNINTYDLLEGQATIFLEKSRELLKEMFKRSLFHHTKGR